MIEIQKLQTINIAELLEKVKAYMNSQYRLVQIGCARIGNNYEINYSFDKDLSFENLKIIVPDTATAVPSISGIYWQSFLYENEIHDLFGLNITGMNIDYKGTFYKLEKRNPY